ncbi:EamA family transporter [Caballeronia sp. LZ065]|uniref:EamA family transporter n=1 Tax=Caballeronia sp. LZ065 TaxID=3038571 RepID=UPI002854F855|nr:EamA family transporter [Caballeronia sp. LZ065]MDR5784756.1 EamA family transporter [Caballeronia sp. LZ065]
MRVFLSPLGLPPLALATWQMGIAVLVLVLAAVTDFDGISHLLDNPFAAVALVIGGGVRVTGVSFFPCCSLPDRFGAVASSVATCLAPAVALLIGWAMGERFGWRELPAFALVVLSVATMHLGRQQTVQRAVA